MSEPPVDDDPERLAEQAWKELEKALPFRDFVRTWGPLEAERWSARLHREPKAQAELKALLEKSRFAESNRVGKAQLDPVLAFIEAQPTLKRHVRAGYRIQLAHTMRAALFGGDAIAAPGVKSKEWKALYERLSSLLARHGRNDPLGNKDFFLVDDEVGEPGHKIEVNNPDILSPALLQDLQAALRGWKNNWYVVVTLNFDDSDLDPGMFVVWEDHVDEALNREQLTTVLGPRFRI